MRSLPVELYTEILLYLDRSELAAVSASTKTLQTLATPLLYRHIVFQKNSSIEQIVRLLTTLDNCTHAIAPLIQRLELDWTGRSDRAATIASGLSIDLPRMAGLTYLAVSPALDIFTWAFDDVTMPALLEFHLASWFKLDRGFLARHPRLKRLSLGKSNGGSPPFVDPMPQGLEYLRMSSATRALTLLERLPHGKDAKLARFDLGVSSTRESYPRRERLEILRLIEDEFPTCLQVNIFGQHAKSLLDDPRAPSIDHVARVGVPCYHHGISHYTDADLRAILVGVARVFPSVRTLDFLGGEDGFANHPLSYQDIARLVQTIHGLRCVELVVFPHGEAYSRSGTDGFEPLSRSRVDDYPRILWPEL
ncbi:hypothetical protein EXIGLDRAFT_721048 [Exidia glandulosa HHB12029]|uniref:F-box domain-containing protein n=1 Tax=Exidia glandulosa HHB12029 TaxID=1314781 RepID=A0A165G0N7_EXIGL|nr:hypothetical protein EXIGLDRAFT_721048 [Exidia glandulosa HHB12029]